MITLISTAGRDKVVFYVLGLTEKEQREMYRAVADLVKMRLSKAQSVPRRE